MDKRFQLFKTMSVLTHTSKDGSFIQLSGFRSGFRNLEIKADRKLRKIELHAHGLLIYQADAGGVYSYSIALPDSSGKMRELYLNLPDFVAGEKITINVCFT